MRAVGLYFLVSWLALANGAVGEERVDYLRQIKPLLARRCGACHGALRQQSELRLDTTASMRKGGVLGAAIEPGRSDQSLLIDAVAERNGMTRMPPEDEGEPLEAEEIALLKAWIDQGADAPDDEQPDADPREHWSFRPPVRPPVPQVERADWVRNPIDAFLAAGHEQHGLTPAPPAGREVLLRRVSLDLIGLPPTRRELHEFLADDSPDAYEQMVDRLLESPRYGERWGRHWMDIWRYSDWYGRRDSGEIRYSQFHIWRWRDWIIESLNADKGYDWMIVEMLAGDEVAPLDPDVLRATGFLARNWYKFNRNTWLQETVEHTGQGFLGLTLRCARCHDHRFDPVSQTDYYRFRAFFEPHDVRTDHVAGEPDTMKDGLARVFDKSLDAATFLFQRGDERYPVKDEPLMPDVPEAFGEPELAIEPVPLPPESYYPVLQPFVAQSLLDKADADIRTAEAAVAKADEGAATARRELEAFDQRAAAAPTGSEEASPESDAFLEDDFSAPRPEFWKILSGQWEYHEGQLRLTQVGNFATIMSLKEHPQDFKARVRYRTTEGGTFRSVGLSFDAVEGRDSQDVYTSANDNRPTVQAFHRKDGRQVYPPAGIVPCEVKVGQEITLEITARGQQLQIAVNGEAKLDYTMPLPRQPGRFALWVHSGTAEFLEARLEPLLPNRDALVQTVEQAEFAVELARRKLATARAERESLTARLAAERARYAVTETDDGVAGAGPQGSPGSATAGASQSLQPRPPAEASKSTSGDAGATEEPTADELAVLAAKAERRVAVRKAEENVLTAERAVAAARAAVPSEAETTEALTEAETKLKSARDALAQAEAAVEQAGSKYTPFGTQYPETSSGRRLALARWIVRPDNPRTARVAVNHVWRRHFGQPLVEPIADFGLRSRPLAHPELLDWLAVEFMEGPESRVESQGPEAGDSRQHSDELAFSPPRTTTQQPNEQQATGHAQRTRDETKWSLKHLHRLIVTSNAYRMRSAAAADDESNLALDPENRLLWRMNARRMEAETVRDSVLAAAGRLDTTMGGPDLDQTLGQTSRRRSLYFRITPDHSMEFLDLFDLASPTECYERRDSVVPQQALAIMNSSVAVTQARLLARQLWDEVADEEPPAVAEGQVLLERAFITAAFEQVLGRKPTEPEQESCHRFLTRHTNLLEKTEALTTFPPGPAPQVAPSSDPAQRARENLVHVLFNHNEFVTVR